jgi:hypothetical protein
MFHRPFIRIHLRINHRFASTEKKEKGLARQALMANQPATEQVKRLNIIQVCKLYYERLFILAYS